MLRGDINAIKIYDYVFIGDNTVLHTAASLPTGVPASINIANDVFVGSKCTLFSCTLDELVYVGDGCTILEGCKIEKGAQIAPGSVVPPGRLIPAK